MAITHRRDVLGEPHGAAIANQHHVVIADPHQSDPGVPVPGRTTGRETGRRVVNSMGIEARRG